MPPTAPVAILHKTRLRLDFDKPISNSIATELLVTGVGACIVQGLLVRPVRASANAAGEVPFEIENGDGQSLLLHRVTARLVAGCARQ